jgi:hypothetical protein
MADPPIKTLRVADLLLDLGNARLGDPSRSQQEAAQALAAQQNTKLVRLAEHIVANGTDPTALVAVVPVKGQRSSYKVLEGNRRVVALQALDTPELVMPALSSSLARRLLKASEKFAERPIERIPCVVFDREDEAHRWVRLRHLGELGGAGLVGWDANEQDRYDARHGGERRPAGQILDFVIRFGSLSREARESKRGVITTVERLLGTPAVRSLLGLKVKDRKVVAEFEAETTALVLTRVVEDLKRGTITVGDVYTKQNQIDYVTRILAEVGATPRNMDQPVRLDDWTEGKVPARIPQAKSKRRRSTTIRKTVIPAATDLSIDNVRIAAIFRELRTLDAELYTNACSVLLRVFLELSIDALLEEDRVISDDEMRRDKLAKRMKTAADHLRSKQMISASMHKAVHAIANRSHSVLGVSVPTFNLYVHNSYVFPQKQELFSAWDEIAPFTGKLWGYLAGSANRA